MVENRTYETNRGIITVATGEYNEFARDLILSAQKNFRCHVYIFTDRPDAYPVKAEPSDDSAYTDITVIEIPHFGWPKMPLLRFELMHRNKEIFREQYLFMVDAEAVFVKQIGNGVLDFRVGVLHRNIMRYRDKFNYETRIESTAYVHPKEGEKYFACGFVGGHRKEFLRMADVISGNIRTDIENGIRARWGDESHLNRYLIDNRPTLVLPPSYMCPEFNPHFKPYIIHRDKDFKRVNKEDTDRYLNVDPREYKNVWN